MTRTAQLVFAAVLAASSAAAAAQGAKPGDYEYYAGIGGGETKMAGYCDAVNSTAGYVGTCDETTSGFKAYGGYKLNRFFGLELGFSNFGQARADGTLNGTPVFGSWKGYAADLSAIGFLPLGDHFELFAKGGVAFWDITSTLATSASGNVNDRGLSGVLGAGATVWLLPQAGLRVQYDWYDNVGDGSMQVQTDVSFLSLSVVGRF
jgi:OmpA-OmpF porin, OOP family